MPRSTKNSQASGSREELLVLSGDEDAVAPPPRLPREEYERLQEMQMSFNKKQCS